MLRLRRLVIAFASAALAASVANPAHAEPFPEVITLPEGWGAEGVASGPGTTMYAGSLDSGAVYRADVRSGQGSILVPGGEGRVAVGLKHSGGLLFVAGGQTGKAFVYDATTGADVAEYQVGPTQGAFVNDVVVTGGAAWFTDSFRPVLYRVPLFAGRPFGPAQEVPLSGDWTQIPGAFNTNGIAATPSGKDLIVVNSTEGALYRVDPASGEATRIDAPEVTAGDGILLQGRTLSVVRNRLQKIAVLELSPDLASATLVDELTDPDFAVPTTVAGFGSSLYAVNARFGLPDGPYTIVKVDGS